MSSCFKCAFCLGDYFLSFWYCVVQTRNKKQETKHTPYFKNDVACRQNLVGVGDEFMIKHSNFIFDCKLFLFGLIFYFCVHQKKNQMGNG